MTAQYQIYKDVHKGIRKELFDLALLAGSTDFSNTGELEALQQQFNRSFVLLEAHAHSEDRYVEPMLNKIKHGISKKLAEAHVKLEGDFSKLKKQLEDISANKTDSALQGHQFYINLTIFISEYLKHIADEEQIASPALCENFSDDELIGASIEIRANIPPPIMQNFLACMIPGMNHPERMMLMTGIKQAAPAEVFTGTCSLAQRVLTSMDWQRLESTLRAQEVA